MLVAMDLKKPQLEVLLTARHERTDGILSCNTHYQMLTKDNNIKPANGDGACLQVSLKIVLSFKISIHCFVGFHGQLYE